MVTFTEIAAHARVSIAAVSRAYTPGASISAKMLAKISLAAKQLGHPLPPLPLVGIGLPPLEVAVVTRMIPPHEQEELLRGLNNAANHWNIQLHTLSAHAVTQDPQSACAAVDGVLLLNGNSDLYQALYQSGKPWLESLCLKEQQQLHRNSIVTVDHFAIGQWLADTLYQRQYQRIYCILTGHDNPIQRQLYSGFAHLMQRAQAVQWQVIRLADSQPRTLKLWLSSLKTIDANTAFCCLDTPVATSLRQGLEHDGRVLPRDGGLYCLGHSDNALEDMSRLVLPLNDMMISSLELLRGQIIHHTRQPELRLIPPIEVAGKTLRV